MYEIKLKQVLKAQVIYIKKWLKCQWSSLLLHYVLSPNLHLWLHGVFPTISWWKSIEKSCLVYRFFYVKCRHHPEMDSCSTIAPFWNVPKRQLKGNPLNGQNFKDYSWLFILRESRNGQADTYILIYGLWTMIWLGRNIFGKLITRRSGEEVYGESSLNGQRMWNICVPCECSLNNDSRKKWFW